MVQEVLPTIETILKYRLTALNTCLIFVKFVLLIAGTLLEKLQAQVLVVKPKSLIGASLSEPHTSVTALRTRVYVRLSSYLWTDHLPEI